MTRALDLQFSRESSMGRKCSVFNCKTGYDTQKGGEKITVYKFPKDPDERHRWVSSLPNKLSIADVTENMGVCSLHWPANVSADRVYVASKHKELARDSPTTHPPEISH